MHRLELAVPPLALTAVLALCMAALALATAGAAPGGGPAWLVAGAAAMLAGVAVCLAGVAAFRRARTTVDPTAPHAASVIVDTGVYAWTRNPMYLGFFLVLLGLGLALASWPAIVVAVLFIPWMNRFQIGPEERILAAKFGPGYQAYRKRVRRWI